ncbi:MAG: Ribosome maturation factor rimP [Anaerosporomusa subterranea]|jgi:ribosome maturation factor RimP|nr:Ribosome maturation factor rimP [Anaerosporomusa subterranea]
MANHIEQSVEKLVLECIEGSGLELVDVEYVRERDWFLRIYIDKAGGIGVEDCQWLSERIGEKLDEADFIRDSYYLEVSSPGLDRPLKNLKDFVRHAGQKIELHTFAPINGKKIIIGTLKELVNNTIILDIDGTEVSVPKDKTSQVRLYIEF